MKQLVCMRNIAAAPDACQWLSPASDTHLPEYQTKVRTWVSRGQTIVACNIGASDAANGPCLSRLAAVHSSVLCVQNVLPEY